MPLYDVLSLDQNVKNQNILEDPFLVPDVGSFSDAINFELDQLIAEIKTNLKTSPKLNQAF
jgi:hypothetical protein